MSNSEFRNNFVILTRVGEDEMYEEEREEGTVWEDESPGGLHVPLYLNHILPPHHLLLLLLLRLHCWLHP